MHTRPRSAGRTLAAMVGAGLVVMAFLLLLHPTSAAALELPNATDLPNLPTLFHSLGTDPTTGKAGAFTTVWDMVVTVSGIVFMVLLLIGGVQYLGAAGNEEQTKKARALLLDAVIGMVLVLVAWPIGRYAIAKLKLNVTVDGKPVAGITDSDRRTAGLRGGTLASLDVTVTGAQSGEQLGLRSPSNSVGDASPAQRLGIVSIAHAASYSQTSTINSGKAKFTNVPTGETLEYVYNGKMLRPATFKCSAELTIGPRSGQPTVATTVGNWLAPTAYAATSITGEDDNFSSPSTDRSILNSSPATSSGRVDNSTIRELESGAENSTSSPGTSSTGKTSNGTNSATPADDTTNTQQQNSATPVDCADKQDEVNVNESIVGKVFVRISVLHQTTTAAIPNFELAYGGFDDPTSINTTVTDSNGYAEVYVKPSTEYWVIPNDTSKYGVTTYKDKTGADSDTAVQKLTFTSPSSPLVANEKDKKTYPAAVWTIFARNVAEGNMVSRNYKLVDSNNVPLAGKKILVTEFQTDSSGENAWTGIFNGGKPEYPDAGGNISLYLPVGRRYSFRYFSISQKQWLNNGTHNSSGSNGECSFRVTNTESSVVTTCKVTTTVDDIYPSSKDDPPSVEEDVTGVPENSN